MPVGVIVSCLAVLIGGVLGYYSRNIFSESMKSTLNATFGLAALVMGVSLFSGIFSLSAVVLALLLGSAIGDLMRIEERVGAGIGNMTRKISWFSNMDDEEVESLISVMILILTSTAGIFGAINEGITGDHTILITKAILDFFVAAIYAADMGMLVPLLSIPQFVFLMILFLSGSSLSTFLSAGVIGDFKGCGGIIIISIAFRLLNVYHFKSLNLLPALILVLPFSHLWTMFFG